MPTKSTPFIPLGPVITEWGPSFDLIVPVPPSRKRLRYQPVVEIVNAVGARLSRSVLTSGIRKVKHAPELKNLFDYQQRMRLLSDAFAVDADEVKRKRILLVDDLF